MENELSSDFGDASAFHSPEPTLRDNLKDEMYGSTIETKPLKTNSLNINHVFLFTSDHSQRPVCSTNKKKKNIRTTQERVSPIKRKASDVLKVSYKKRCVSGIHVTLVATDLVTDTSSTNNLNSSNMTALSRHNVSGFLHLNQGHYCSLKATIICDGTWKGLKEVAEVRSLTISLRKVLCRKAEPSLAMPLMPYKLKVWLFSILCTGPSIKVSDASECYPTSNVRFNNCLKLQTRTCLFQTLWVISSILVIRFVVVLFRFFHIMELDELIVFLIKHDWDLKIPFSFNLIYVLL